MQLTLTTTPSAGLAAAALVRLVATEPKPASGLLAELFENGEFSGKAAESVLLHRPEGVSSPRLLLLGLGDPAKITTSTLRQAGGQAAKALKGKGFSTAVLEIPESLSTPGHVEALAEGILLADYDLETYKTERKAPAKPLSSFELSVPQITPELQAALDCGRILAEGQNFARGLINEPGNVLTPLKLAAAAQSMAAEFGLECEILDEGRLKQLGMHTLLGVAMGSAQPPALIVLKYKPENPTCADHLAFVGKGVTFDTGGISIKPSDGMEKMKYDMAGAASVLGAMRALAQLKPSVAVTAFAPCVENMPGDKAQRPGDIVKSYQGKTVEVLNTDAEGRLILADALTYAARQGCTHLVNAATLTGAIAVALGHFYAGAFSNNEDFQAKVLAAAKAEGERLWPFPMDEDYKELLKSPFADLANIGGRWGGSISAAKFLEEFVESKPWVHLDIAGVAWLEADKPYLPKGPSGYSVRTFARLALDWK